MPTKKKRHGGNDEEHESHERWLITYADMLTLLMVLFIVLFAMSQVDKKKFAELAQGLASGFGAKSVTFNAQSSDELSSIYKQLARRLGTVTRKREVTATFAIGGLVLLALAAVGSTRWSGRLP